MRILTPKPNRKTIPDSITNLKYLTNEFEELSTEQFYRYIFPVGSFENKGNTSENKPNGILIHGTNGTMHKRLVFDDLKELIEVAKSGDDCFISPIGYIGRTSKKVNARKLYALAFDIDYLRLYEGDEHRYFCGVHKFLDRLFEVDWIYSLVKPNLLALSSDGHLHLYYVFETPMNCYSENLEQLQKIKNEMTETMWRWEFIDIYEHPTQYESVVQNFRIVGSTNNKHGNKIHGFFYHKEKYKSVEDLFEQIKKRRIQMHNEEENYKYVFKLYEPKTKPQILSSNIKMKPTQKTCWKIKPDLYEWYFKFLYKNKSIVGSRYWRCFVLSSIAYKCRIPKEELISDLKILMDKLNENTFDESPFTWDDVKASLKGYSPEYCKVSIDFVNKKCECPTIVKRNRKKDPQELHLKKARFSRDLNCEMKGIKWDDNNGRKPKKDIVKQWRANNPTGTKYRCQKETGISKPTILKWWDIE